jgi:hypothetical protein
MIADRKTTIDEALVDRNEALTQDNVGKTRYIMEHNWEEEWYPMYLAFEMPLNSPLRFIILTNCLSFFMTMMASSIALNIGAHIRVNCCCIIKGEKRLVIFINDRPKI